MLNYHDIFTIYMSTYFHMKVWSPANSTTVALRKTYLIFKWAFLVPYGSIWYLYSRNFTLTSDLRWVVAANVAIKTMGGPTITTRYGRVDAVSASESASSASGRLPEADKDEHHLRSLAAMNCQRYVEMSWNVFVFFFHMISIHINT
jgi:hypothetical protein